MKREVYWKWDGAIEPDTCDAILADVAKLDFPRATVGNVGANEFRTDPAIRDCGAAFLKRMHPIECILGHYGREANAGAGWNMDLSHMRDSVQIAQYVGRDGGGEFYGPHNDLMIYPNDPGFERKLTVVLMLSRTADYTGGGLSIERAPPVQLTQGSIIAFPAFSEHEVQPVTRGTRYTATTWLSGPRFK